MADQAKEKRPKKGTGTVATISSRSRKSPGQATVCPDCGAENAPESRFCANCASPLKQASGARTVRAATFEISRGALFADRYEIIESLGQGGMGKVYKAFDRKVNEVLALKLIRPEIGVNDKAIERFKNELKVARKITHRNICRMYDLGEQDYLHYITMEYVAGEDLKRFIHRAGTLSAGKAVNIARQVGEGLAEAHRMGVIHRDLKPQNIMIDQDGNAKIMDFGIARFIDAEGMTGSGVMIGTPEYMSPEQAELLEVDKRADIYSLGIVLYEMTSGRVPFEGETPLSIAMKHKTEKPRSVRELNALIPVKLAGIISKCMEKSPADRYQTAEELLADLEKTEQDLGTGERVVPRKAAGGAKTGLRDKKEAGPAPARAAAGKKKLLLPAVLLAAAAVAVFVILKILPGRGSEPALEAARNQVAENIPPSGTAAANTAKETQPETKPIIKPETKPVSPPETKAPASQDSGSAPAVKKVETKPGSAAAKPDAPRTETLDPDAASANLAQARMTAARSQAEKKADAAASPLFRVAEANGQEAQKRLAQKNMIEARGLFVVSERLFRLCTDSARDEDRIKSLKAFVEDLRKETAGLKPSPAQEKTFLAAREAETQAAAFQVNKDWEGAVRRLVQAADYYQSRIFLARSARTK